MLGFNGIDLSPSVIWQTNSDALLVLLVGTIMVYALPTIRRYAHTPIRFLLIPLFLWALTTLSAQSFTPFLYFQF
jgi:alginate O-acetyltransferase complex protein AlgI